MIMAWGILILVAWVNPNPKPWVTRRPVELDGLATMAQLEGRNADWFGYRPRPRMFRVWGFGCFGVQGNNRTVSASSERFGVLYICTTFVQTPQESPLCLEGGDGYEDLCSTALRV